MESMKTVVCNKLRDLDKKCDRYLLYNKDDENLAKFKDSYNKLYNWEEEGCHCQIIHLYALAVLDLTFFEENQLTKDEFQSPNSKEMLQSIIGNISGIKETCREYTDTPTTLLGKDTSECILWRRGALLYMYCATVEHNEEVLARDLAYFLKCLLDGIEYLRQMTNIRKPLRVPRSKVTSNSDDTYFLLSEGIYSDTTVLALMYAGEMCYWFDKHYQPAATEGDPVEISALGNKFLKRYIKAAEGPLKGKGWNTSKAKEILALTKTCERK